MDHLSIPNSKEHKELVSSFAATHAKEISKMLLNVPRPLLLLLKTNDCLRAVDIALGQPINNFIITARACSRALAEHRMQVAKTSAMTMQSSQLASSDLPSTVGGGMIKVSQYRIISIKVANAVEALSVELRIVLLKWLSWWSKRGQAKPVASSMI